MARIRHELRANVSRTCSSYFMPADVVTQVLNFGCRRMIDVQIEGRDPHAAFADRARRSPRRCASVPGTEDVRIAQVFDHPALRLDVDRQQAMQLEHRISRRREQRADVAQLVAALQPELLARPARTA